MAAASFRVCVVSLLGLALASSAVRAQGAVLVVDGGNGPYLTLQSAIDAAADGDTILVHSGFYLPFTLTDRSLTIAADEGSDVTCSIPAFSTEQNLVQDLGTNDVVVLRGLKLSGLDILSSHGSVWVEDCVIGPQGMPLRVESSEGIVLVRDTLVGSDSFMDPYGQYSQPLAGGARLTNSVVTMLDCTVTGGNGQGAGWTQVGIGWASGGADAIEVHGGELRLSGGSAVGGKGGGGANLWPSGCFAGAPGGDGVWLADGNPMLIVRDSALAGGAGGAGAATFPPCDSGDPSPGAPGLPVSGQTGAVTYASGPARSLALGEPVNEQHSVNLHVAGAPGDLVLLLVSAAPRPTLKSATAGVLLVPLPALVVTLGTLGNPAQLDLPVTLPELGPGVQTIHVFVQGVFKPATGATVLGSGSVLIGLDSVY
jgi:hypothetical protein